MDPELCSLYTTIQIIAQRCNQLTDLAMVVKVQEIMLVSIKLEGCHAIRCLDHLPPQGKKANHNCI